MAEIKALFFDQDGVIVDTERDGHRVAFNRAFAEAGYPVEWDELTYHRLLQVGGGKERMRHHMATAGFGSEIAPEKVDEVIGNLHKRKTDLFIEMLEEGALPLRPGVHRVMRAAAAEGLLLGICTTSNERSAEAIRSQLLPDIPFTFILAGDVVSRKKPDPEIYLMALEKAGVAPENAVVFEDSNIGARAARAADCRVVATVNGYTRDEDLSMADLTVSALGEPDVPADLLASRRPVDDWPGYLTLDWLRARFA